jgi:hypothetical protein
LPDPFLRNQILQRNMFLHLVIAHRRNVSLNLEALDRLQQQLEDAQRECPGFAWKLVFDEKTGRMQLDC